HDRPGAPRPPPRRLVLLHRTAPRPRITPRPRTTPRSHRAMRSDRESGDRSLIWGMALGYFAFYIPYSGLTRALSQGILPGAARPVAGLTILPATAVVTSVALLLAVAAFGGL